MQERGINVGAGRPVSGHGVAKREALRIGERGLRHAVARRDDSSLEGREAGLGVATAARQHGVAKRVDDVDLEEREPQHGVAKRADDADLEEREAGRRIGQPKWMD